MPSQLDSSHEHARPSISIAGAAVASAGARPVHLIITTMKWIQTSRLPIKNSFSASEGGGCGTEAGHEMGSRGKAWSASTPHPIPGTLNPARNLRAHLVCQNPKRQLGGICCLGTDATWGGGAGWSTSRGADADTGKGGKPGGPCQRASTHTLGTSARARAEGQTEMCSGSEAGSY